MNAPHKFFKGFLLIAAIALMAWLGFAVQQGAFKGLGQASILSAGTDTDPNGIFAGITSCQARSSATLRVTGGGGAYDWYAENVDRNGRFNDTKYSLLRWVDASGGVRSGDIAGLQFSNTGDTVTFVAPTEFDTLLSNHFRVNAVAVGAEPWAGNDASFEIYISPPCVTRLEFIDPSPTRNVEPDASNQVTIQTVRAGFSNGTTRDLGAEEISGLPLTVEPSTGARINGNVITLPENHGLVTVDIEMGADNLSPIYRDQQLIDVTDGRFDLDSNEVNRSSLEVHTVNGDGSVGALIIEGNYQFHEGEGAAQDFLTVTEPADTLQLFVSYSYPNPAATLSAVQPLTVSGNTCQELQASLVQGVGGGVGAGGANQPVPLDRTMFRGETKTIYSTGGSRNPDAAQSAGTYAWRSSDPDVLEVKALADRPSDRELVGNEDISFNQNLQDATKLTLTNPNGFATASNCQYEEVEGAADQLVSCDVSIFATVNYSFAGDVPYGITISRPAPDGPLQNATVTGNGIMTGTVSGQYLGMTFAGGGSIAATGTLTGNVTGDANGPVVANVTMNFLVGRDELDEGDVSGITELQSATGTLAKTPDLVPAIVDPRGVGEAIVTDFAVVTAKASRKATLFVTDQAGCTAAIEITVQAEKLTLESPDYTPGAVLEINDSFNVTATLGQTAEQRTDVTNLVTWVSDNPQIATVSDRGRVTAVAPGNANITATYTTQGEDSQPVVSEGRIPVRVNFVEGLTVTLDKAALDRLDQATRDAAYRNVVIAINSASAAGKTITIEGKTFTLSVPNPGNEVAQVQAIRDDLDGQLNTANTGVSDTVEAVKHASLVGVVTLSIKTGNDKIDIATTANPEELMILPVLTQTITLDRNLTYPTQVIAEYDNGLTKRFTNRTGLTWVATPLNYLDDALLLGGLVKAGDLRGTSRLHVAFNNGFREITGNTLTFEVPNTPYIEYAEVIGNSNVVSGATLQLAMKVGDADTFGDIETIEAFIARPDNAERTTYDDIFAHSQKFSLQVLLDQVQVQEEGAPNGNGAENEGTAGEGEDGMPPPADGADGAASGWIPAAYAETNQPFSKILRFPVQIPQIAELTDGPYKLLIQVTDRSGQAAKFVRDILVGAAASGDVNGNGTLDINDAIATFRFYTGRDQANQAQLNAIDANRNGRVDLLEVITVLRAVMSRV